MKIAGYILAALVLMFVGGVISAVTVGDPEPTMVTETVEVAGPTETVTETVEVEVPGETITETVEVPVTPQACADYIVLVRDVGETMRATLDDYWQTGYGTAEEEATIYDMEALAALLLDNDLEAACNGADL